MQYINNIHLYTSFKNTCAKKYPNAHLVFAGVCRSSSANMPEKGLTEFKCLFFFVSAVPQLTYCAVSNELDSVVIHSHMLIAPSEYAFIHFANNRDINVPNEKKAVSKAFMFYSKEPEFPTSMLFGLCLGLAFRCGCEHFVGVRQSRALLGVQGEKSLHQGL